MDEVDVIIAGAGLHGLIMAKTYLEVHPDSKLLIVEKAASVGGSWCKERLYPGLKTNNLIGSYEFGDFPMDPQRYGVKPGEHIPGAVVHQYLSDFAAHYQLYEHLVFHTSVASAELQSDDRWLVVLQDLSATFPGRRVLTKKLVIATGLTSEPNIPTFNGQSSFKGDIFHAKELNRRAEGLASKKSIVVVGGNKSSWDTCYTAARQGTKVHMLIRPLGGPSYLFPKTIPWGPFEFSVLVLAGTRVYAPLDPSPFGFSGLLTYLLHRTLIGQWLCRLFWTRLDRRIKTLHGFDTHPEVKKLEPWTTPFWAGNSLSTHNYETNWFDLVREGMIKVHIAEIQSLSGDTVTLTDGESFDAETIVCCTGWKLEPTVKIEPSEANGVVEREAKDAPDLRSQTYQSRRWLQEAVPQLFEVPARTSNAPPIEDAEHIREESDRRPLQLYRYMVPDPHRFIEKKNIAFIGMAPAILTGIASQAQALWITAFLDNKIPNLRHEVVDVPKAAYETILHSEYQRARRPREAGGVGGKHGEIIFDCLTYVDTMLVELGLNPKRSSWWTEYFQPHFPKHYKGLVQEWLGSVKKPD